MDGSIGELLIALFGLSRVWFRCVLFRQTFKKDTEQSFRSPIAIP